jgi:hypothetical protein
MKLRKLSGLLIVLVSSAFLDDAWAAVTADTVDDVQAAANNEYLRAPRGRDNDSPREEPSFAGGAAARSAGPAIPALVPGVSADRPITPVRTSLLDLFMSLRR